MDYTRNTNTPLQPQLASCLVRSLILLQLFPTTGYVLETTWQTLKASLISLFGWRKFTAPIFLFPYFFNLKRVLPAFFFTYYSNPLTLPDVAVMNSFSQPHTFLLFSSLLSNICHVFLFIIEKQLLLTHLYNYYCQTVLSAPKLVTYKTTARQSWLFCNPMLADTRENKTLLKLFPDYFPDNFNSEWRCSCLHSPSQIIFLGLFILLLSMGQ